MTDLCVIILTKDEELHIRRCLERLAPLEPRQVFVIDCFSTDATCDIARACGATVVQHTWPGNQAAQFNWALDTLPIKAAWILRLDADEYLFPETIEEVRGVLGADADCLPADITSFSMERTCTFLGRRVRHGAGKVVLTRFFKNGLGRYPARLMDEHIVTTSGHDLTLKGRFIDDNLNNLEWWRAKHRRYARREAEMVLDGAENNNKRLYYKLPPFFRAAAYFCYRYFLRGGVLDGVAGWRWNFWQGLWYRWLVDATILQMKRDAAKRG